MFEIPKVSKCCLCVNLRTGILTLAWIATIFWLWALSHGLSNINDFRNSVGRWYEKLFNSTTGHEIQTQESIHLRFLVTHKSEYYFLAITEVLTDVGMVLAFSCLLFGIYREKNLLVRFWQVFVIVLFTIDIVRHIYMFYREQSGEPMFEISARDLLMVEFLLIVYTFYLWVCVYSLLDNRSLIEVQLGYRNNLRRF